MSKIPAFIIARDRVSCLRDMVNYLLQPETECEPIILDNASTNPELISYYDTNPCTVHRLPLNYGNCSVLFGTPTCMEGFVKPDFLNEYNCKSGYILSDCDLGVSHIPTNFVSVFREGFAKYEWATKIGFQLRIHDLPDNEIGNMARGWEAGNHAPHAYLDDSRFIRAAIDTTFAMYRWIDPPNTTLAHDFDRSVRVDAPYDAIHYSWYYSLQNPPPPDELYYLNHLDGANFNHYSIRLLRTLNGQPIE